MAQVILERVHRGDNGQDRQLGVCLLLESNHVDFSMKVITQVEDYRIEYKVDKKFFKTPAHPISQTNQMPDKNALLALILFPSLRTRRPLDIIPRIRLPL